MKKRAVIIIIAIVLAGIAGYFFFGKNGDSKTSWRLAMVDRGDVKIEVTATGTINADTTVNVGTQVSGTIAKLNADFNSVVKKGQIIAVLDTTFLAASVEDASAAVEKA